MRSTISFFIKRREDDEKRVEGHLFSHFSLNLLLDFVGVVLSFFFSFFSSSEVERQGTLSKFSREKRVEF